MSAGYTGPACQQGNHGSCQGFWPAKFGAKGRGTTCACPCHGHAKSRCLWPACSRPLPCPVHSTMPGTGVVSAPVTFDPLPPDYVHRQRSARESRAPQGGAQDLPIGDYDDLSVAEIISVLDELDLDELDDLRSHELQGRNRSAVIRAIDRQMDALELEHGFEGAGEVHQSSGDGHGDLSILDDYDRLSVFQIMGLLEDLEDDDLALVAELEEQGRSRGGILDRIDDILAARDAAARHAGSGGGLGRREAAPGERGPGSEATRDHGSSFRDEDVSAFPINDYDSLGARDIVALLGDLDYEELQMVRAREEHGRNRVTVIRALDRALSLFEPVDDEGAGKEGATLGDSLEAPAPPVGDDQAEGGYDETEGDYEEEEEVDQELTGHGADDRAPEPAEDADDFVIEDYDSLPMFQILRLLPELSPGQLEVVGEMEAEGKNRAAILDRIDSLLSR